jgi:hypothetical protein
MTNPISIDISTTSTVTKWSAQEPHLPPAQLPTVTVNQLKIQPARIPSTPTGLQLVVFDITQAIPTPASILVNEYFGVFPLSSNSNSWSSTYYNIYGTMIFRLLGAGRPENQLVLLASFGFDFNMAPNNEAYSLLLSYGAGQALQTWENTSGGGGSQIGDPTSWVSFPANYLFVGFGSVGYGAGQELFERSSQGNTVSSRLRVTVDPSTRKFIAS